MYYIEKIKCIENELTHNFSVNEIINLRKNILYYLDEQGIELEYPFKKERYLIVSYLRLLRKCNIYLNYRHCRRYNEFTNKTGLFFDNEFWHNAINISYNQSDFIYLIALWKQQIIQMDSLWNELINELLFELYKRVLELLNDKYGVHNIHTLIENIKNSIDAHHNEKELSVLLDKYDIGEVFSSSKITENNVFLVRKDVSDFFGDITSIIDDISIDRIYNERNALGDEYLLHPTQSGLSIKDKALFLSWDKKISRDEKIKHLLDLIGRGMKLPKLNFGLGRELSSLKFGREIQTVLPSELVQITEDNLSYLFDLKYIEEKLLSFELNSSFFKIHIIFQIEKDL